MAPFRAAVSFTQASVASLQESAVQPFVSEQLREAPPPHTPLEQTSLTVQKAPSSQALPLAATVSFTQVSAVSLQASAVHWLPSEQFRATPPPHAPALQVSPTVQ